MSFVGFKLQDHDSWLRAEFDAASSITHLERVTSRLNTDCRACARSVLEDKLLASRPGRPFSENPSDDVAEPPGGLGMMTLMTCEG